MINIVKKNTKAPHIGIIFSNIVFSEIVLLGDSTFKLDQLLTGFENTITITAVPTILISKDKKMFQGKFKLV